MGMFEKASRMKLRFATEMGNVSSEDLWDLPLTVIDELAVRLKKSLSDENTQSFITDKTADNDMLQLKFDIAKHIIDIRLDDIQKAKDARAIKMRNQRILEIMAQKEDGDLQEKSMDELRAMLKETEAA